MHHYNYVNIYKLLKNIERDGIMYTIIIILAIIQIVSLQPYLVGTSYMVMLDGINQYTHFYTEFSRILKEGKNIFWNWHQGIGGNFYGAMAYYVLSPIMLILLILLPTSSVPYLFIIAFIIKQQLAAVFMYKLLNTYKFEKIVCIVISLLWACNSYFLHYADNPMWLDALYLLPLAFIGIENIRKNNKYVIFVLAVALSAITNYYLFFSFTIFVYLYIVGNCILTSDKLNFKKILVYMIKITLYYLLGVLIASAVLIPAVFAIKESSRASTMEIPSIVSFKFSVLKETLKGIFFNTCGYFNVVYKSAAMSYFGNICLLLMSLVFIFKNKIKNKIRIISIAVIFLEVLSVSNEFIYMAFHGFSPPVAFPFRFMYGFIAFNLIISAYIFDKVLKSEVKISCCTLILVMLATVILLKEKSIVIIGSNIIILVIYYLFINLKSKKLILIPITIELIISSSMMINNYLPIALTNEASNQYFYDKEYEELIELIKDNNEIERIFENYSLRHPEALRNISFTYGYSGLNTFTSTDNKYYQEFYELLKLKEDSIGIVNLTGNLFSNEILNVKYSILKNESPIPYGYRLIKKGNNYSIYENLNYLNGGYISNNFIKESTFEELSTIDKEIMLINNIIVQDDLNVEENYSLNIDKSLLQYSIIDNNVIVHNKLIDTTEIENPYIEIEINNMPYTINELFLEFSADNKFRSIEIESDGTNYYIPTGIFTSSSRLVDLGEYTDSIRVRVNLESNVVYDFKYFNFYSINMSDYSNQLESIRANSFDVFNVSENNVYGEITAEKSGELFTTIPYNSSWEVYVNGEQVEYKRVNECFIGINVSEGKNIIEMRYVPKGFYIGAIFSIIGMIVLIIMLVGKTKIVKLH